MKNTPGIADIYERPGFKIRRCNQIASPFSKKNVARLTSQPPSSARW